METSPCKDQNQGQGLDHKDQDKDKDLTHKDQDKDEDLTPKDQGKDKDLTPKDQDKDMKNVLKESLRTRARISIPVHKRPGHPGSPDVLSANRFLHFRRCSEACFGRMERVVCKVYVYFRSYYPGFYYCILAFSKYLPTHYIARATTKRHLAGDCL